MGMLNALGIGGKGINKGLVEIKNREKPIERR
jgi:hypothetical protein